MAHQTYGLDMYPATSLPDSASVKQLVQGWNAWLQRFPIRARAALTYIDEVGIAAQSHAYTHPSLHNWSTPIIPVIQSKWFQAACVFYRQHNFRGLYFWSINMTTGPQLNYIGGTPIDFQGLTAPVIKTCFKQ
jgi:hypothetical protein